MQKRLDKKDPGISDEAAESPAVSSTTIDNDLPLSAISYEDPLAHLLQKPIQEFARGCVICDPQQTSGHLYVVIRAA